METEKTGYERALELIEECKQTRSTTLDLGNLGLTEIPDELWGCAWLKELNFGDTFHFIEDMGWIKSKNSLSSNKLDIIPKNIKSLNKLQILSFNNNKISKIENLDELSNLKKIYFIKNKIRKIENLQNLKYLYKIHLAYNSILKVENLNELENLSILYLNGNPIINLTPLLPFIKNKNLKVQMVDDDTLAEEGIIYLEGCPLIRPPIEIASKGNEAIIEYFKALKAQGIDHLYEAKTLIIGKAGAGKTSLRYKLKDQKCKLPEDNESTKGIDIDPITFPIPKENRDFNVNIWDFGGQEIYHNTHQFFLTKRSLYVLVADYRTEKHEINYWMQIVEMMGGGSPLLIVQNEKDNRVGDLNLPGLKSQYNEIYKDDFRVDLRAVCEGEHYKIESEKAFRDLQTEIRSKLLQLPHIGDVLPKQWVIIRKEIEKLAAEKAYISEDEFYDLCTEHKITDNQKQKDLSQYFHDLGVFLHFQNENKPTSLSEIVILQNTWATEAVYKVLDSTLVKDEQFGRFTYKDLKQIWQDSTWRSKAKELLELMMEFQLCYQIADTNEYIAPQLLPAQQPDYPWDKNSNLQLRYRYGFMPKGIITRFIVKMHRYIAEGQTLVWKEGVILEHQGAKAEVIETYRDNEIHIRVGGNRGKELLTIIAHNIDELNSSFEKIRVDKLVPCNCSECKELEEPYFYKYQNLVRRKSKGKRTVECEISYKDVNVLKLIEDVLISNFADKEEVRQLIRKPDLKRAIRLLENMVAPDSPEENDLIVIQSNFNALMQKVQKGTIKDDDYSVEQAKITNALLSFLETI